VQLLHPVLVFVFRLFAGSMNVGMRMLLRVGVLVGMGMDRVVGMLVLVRMDVRVDVGISGCRRDGRRCSSGGEAGVRAGRHDRAD